MTKLSVFGAVTLLSVLTGPALAREAIVRPDTYYYYVRNARCAYHQLGNPYTPEEDYMAWSAWRARGGWDDRNDWYCLRDTHLRHPAAGY